jgi:DNA-binding NarL/FixJ family response regulator
MHISKRFVERWSKDKVKQACIRVLIADDVLQVRQGLATMLKLAAKNYKPRTEVVGEAQNGSEVIQQSQALHPDVVLMGLEMPVVDGYEATRWIKANLPATRVIILSIHAGLEEQQRARLAGADGFVTKGSSYKFLLYAILSITISVNSNCPKNGGKNE